jgi:hypothetical protein
MQSSQGHPLLESAAGLNCTGAGFTATGAAAGLATPPPLAPGIPALGIPTTTGASIFGVPSAMTSAGIKKQAATKSLIFIYHP